MNFELCHHGWVRRFCDTCMQPGSITFVEEQPNMSALNTQVGGSHYKDFAIQPVEYIHKNKIPFIEGCAIKYLTRWRDKGGVEDLKKARHFIDMLIEMEQENA